MGVKKNNKRIRVSRCSVASQNSLKNKQHTYTVIYTVITLSLNLIPFLYYETIKSMFCVLVVLGKE